MDQSKTGKLIANSRKEKNMTQEQLSMKMGVSINAVSKWERGLSFPDVSLYKKLCEELGISIEELINGERDNSEEAKTKAIINTVKSKEKVKKRLYLVIMFSIIIILLLIIGGIFIYKNKDDELTLYYKRNYEKAYVGRDVEALMKYMYDGKYPDYYGGMYISDDAYNLILLIVKDKIPIKGSLEYNYYNEILNVDNSIKVKYVNNSYNDLEKVFNTINDYITTNTVPEYFNGVGIEVIKNKVVVNCVTVNESIINDFKEKIVNSDLVELESTPVSKNMCTNYPEEIGTDILETHAKLLINITIGSNQYIPVSLSVFDDGTYELYTAYKDCKPGRPCNAMLKYTKSIKGKYDYDIDNIIKESTNANDKTFPMDNLPEYEIYLGEKYINKYDTLSFVVEKGKKNKYLDEFLKLIDVDLSKCAKPEYKD